MKNEQRLFNFMSPNQSGKYTNPHIENKAFLNLD